MNKIANEDTFDNKSFEDKLSIVVVTHKRLDFLKSLVKTLSTAIDKISHDKPKIVICINGPDTETENFIDSEDFFKKINVNKLYLESPLTPAKARNVASLQVTTEWIFFLDDDVEVPENIFVDFKKLINKYPETSLWGGPNLTPKDSSLTQHKIGWFLESYLVTGPFSSRYSLNRLQERDGGELFFCLCNMFVKSEHFKKIEFNSKLKTAEENELIYKFAKNNLKMKNSNLLYVWHHRRSSISKFLSQINNYGYGRGQLIFNRSISAAGYFVTISIFTVVLVLAINFPLQLAIAFMLWQLLIYVKLILHFKFEAKNIFDIFIPIRLWANYFTGILKGYFNSFKS